MLAAATNSDARLELILHLARAEATVSGAHLHRHNASCVRRTCMPPPPSPCTAQRCVIVERPVAFEGRTAELISLVHSSLPPMYSPATTSSPNLHSTFSPTRLLPITCTTVPPDTGPDAGATANTVADDMYSNASSDVLHTSLFKLAEIGIRPFCALVTHTLRHAGSAAA